MTGEDLDTSFHRPGGIDNGSPEHGIYCYLDDNLEQDDYTIVVTNDGNVTITGGLGSGLWYGMYDFLEEHLDARFFDQDTIWCPTVGAINIEPYESGVVRYDPVFEAREVDSYWTSSVWSGDGKRQVHLPMQTISTIRLQMMSVVTRGGSFLVLQLALIEKTLTPLQNCFQMISLEVLQRIKGFTVSNPVFPMKQFMRRLSMPC